MERYGYVEQLELELEQLEDEIERLERLYENCEEELEYYREGIKKIEQAGYGFEEAIGMLILAKELGIDLRRMLQEKLRTDNVSFKKALRKGFYTGNVIQYFMKDFLQAIHQQVYENEAYKAEWRDEK